jgi:hypothetical protein
MDIYILQFSNDPINIYLTMGDALERLKERYNGINFGTGINKIIGMPPNPDDEDFVIVDATQPPPPPPPAGGGEKIRFVKVQLMENVEDTINIIAAYYGINPADDVITNIRTTLTTKGGKKRFGKSSSRPRRRSSKKRGTQRKQKRRQRRGSRRA